MGLRHHSGSSTCTCFVAPQSVFLQSFYHTVWPHMNIGGSAEAAGPERRFTRWGGRVGAGVMQRPSRFARCPAHTVCRSYYNLLKCLIPAGSPPPLPSSQKWDRDLIRGSPERPLASSRRLNHEQHRYECSTYYSLHMGCYCHTSVMLNGPGTTPIFSKCYVN